MWLDSLKAAGYSTNTLNTRRCQMSALSRALGGDPRDVEGDDLLAHFADQPRRKADVLYKAYLTPDMDARVRAQAEREHIGKSALIRKALAAYLTANQAQPAMA